MVAQVSNPIVGAWSDSRWNGNIYLDNNGISLPGNSGLGQPVEIYKKPYNRLDSTIAKRRAFNYMMWTHSDYPDTSKGNLRKLKFALSKLRRKR